MSRWTAEEIFESYVNNPDVGGDRVHWQRSVPFTGQPGHYYFLRGRRRALNHRDLARITAHSGHPEVTLIRINSAYIVYVGNRGVATATVRIPVRQDGIEEFEWIAHTHPLEQENAYQGIARGPTGPDRDVMRIVSARWGQTESTVVVCRGGHVEGTAPVRPEPDGSDTRGPDGRIWTPGGD